MVQYLSTYYHHIIMNMLLLFHRIVNCVRRGTTISKWNYFNPFVIGSVLVRKRDCIFGTENFVFDAKPCASKSQLQIETVNSSSTRKFNFKCEVGLQTNWTSSQIDKNTKIEDLKCDEKCNFKSEMEVNERLYLFVDINGREAPFDSSTILDSNLFDTRRWKTREFNVLEAEFIEIL
jgi:hypothetical protein